MGFEYRNPMTVASHRGDSYNYYENTMQAFEAAILAGCDMIETDIHMTKDGHLILMHDDDTMRTTRTPGKISDKTLDEMLALNAGSPTMPAKVPTLEEFLAWAAPKDILLNLELKEYYFPGNEERARECVDKTIALVRKYGLEKRIVINSFDAWVLEYTDEAYNHEFLLHGFYPYFHLRNVMRNPDEYLFCACVFADMHDKANFDYLTQRGIEPWIGAGCTSKDVLAAAFKNGAKLVTTNYTADTIAKLAEIGARA